VTSTWEALQFLPWPQDAQRPAIEKDTATKLAAAADTGVNSFTDWPALNRNIALASFERAVGLGIMPQDYDKASILGLVKITEHHMELRASWAPKG
jgi:hypothetical protein